MKVFFESYFNLFTLHLLPTNNDILGYVTFKNNFIGCELMTFLSLDIIIHVFFTDLRHGLCDFSIPRVHARARNRRL